MSIPATGKRFAKALILRALRVCFRVLDQLRGARPVVVYYAWPDFARKANALAEALASGGIPTVVRSGNSFLARARVRTSSLLHVGFWNHFYPQDMPARYIFYNAEPLGLSRWRDNAEWQQKMQGALQIWSYASGDEQRVANSGIPFRYVPFGYAPYYEQIYQQNIAGENIVEDVDVLFVGFVSDRRRILLDRIRQTGVKLEVVTYEKPLRGAALDCMIARARIVLSIYATDDQATHVADLARLDHLLSNGRFVLHEELPAIARDAEFETHVATCPYNEIPERCLHFLQSGVEREKAAREAQLWFKANRPISGTLPFDEIKVLMQ